MARSLAEFLRAAALSRLPSSVGDCSVCHMPITDEHPDEVRFIGDAGAKKPVHEDCYFAEFDSIVDQHPIFNPVR